VNPAPVQSPDIFILLKIFIVPYLPQSSFIPLLLVDHALNAQPDFLHGILLAALTLPAQSIDSLRNCNLQDV
jgi:hypothetical protein